MKKSFIVYIYKPLLSAYIVIQFLAIPSHADVRPLSEIAAERIALDYLEYSDKEFESKIENQPMELQVLIRNFRQEVMLDSLLKCSATQEGLDYLLLHKNNLEKFFIRNINRNYMNEIKKLASEKKKLFDWNKAYLISFLAKRAELNTIFSRIRNILVTSAPQQFTYGINQILDETPLAKLISLTGVLSQDKNIADLVWPIRKSVEKISEAMLGPKAFTCAKEIINLLHLNKNNPFPIAKAYDLLNLIILKDLSYQQTHKWYDFQELFRENYENLNLSSSDSTELVTKISDQIKDFENAQSRIVKGFVSFFNELLKLSKEAKIEAKID